MTVEWTRTALLRYHNLGDLRICLVTFDLTQTEIQMAQPLTGPSSSSREPRLCRTVFKPNVLAICSKVLPLVSMNSLPPILIT